VASNHAYPHGITNRCLPIDSCVDISSPSPKLTFTLFPQSTAGACENESPAGAQAQSQAVQHFAARIDARAYNIHPTYPFPPRHRFEIPIIILHPQAQSLKLFFRVIPSTSCQHVGTRCYRPILPDQLFKYLHRPNNSLRLSAVFNLVC
jgi:hypothetical protein